MRRVKVTGLAGNFLAPVYPASGGVRPLPGLFYRVSGWTAFTAVDFTATEIQSLEEETFHVIVIRLGGRAVVLQMIRFLPFGLPHPGALVI